MENIEEKYLLAKNSPFTRKIYNAVSLDRPNDNIIISPFSIAACLAMARIGTQGKTADEIDKALELGTNNVTEIGKIFGRYLNYFKLISCINFAARIYVMSGCKIQQTFNDIVSEHFCSDAKEVDFKQKVAAAKSINDWVEMKTNHRIQNLISSDALNANTRLVLINAIHFKSKWSTECEFDKEKTKDDKFYLNESDFVTVPMMYLSTKIRYGDMPEWDATAIQLKYIDEDCAMLIILPNSRTGLKALEEKLKNIPLYEILDKMYFGPVIVKLPRFKVEFSIELTEPLRELGMTTMFTDEADFSKMLETPIPVNVSTIIHKAFIDVDEEGTEAAAVTEMQMEFRKMLRGCKQELQEFTADRPFYYCIHNRDKYILYCGSVQRI